MKKLLVLLLFFVSIALYSQPKGIRPFILINNAIEYENALEAPNGIMYKINYGDFINTYFVFYPPTPVGTKRVIDRASQILSENNLSIHSPHIKDDLFASYVSSIYDFQSLNTSVLVGSGAISRIWNIEQWALSLVLEENTRGILIFKID